MPESLLQIEAWSFELDGDLDSSLLHPLEVQRAAQITDPVRRSRYERSRFLLRKVLAGRLAINPKTVSFDIAPEGKPGVEGCEFSISHSGSRLVVAVSDIAIGVDIETQRRHTSALKLAERFFSARDIQSLLSIADTHREAAFIRQWVAKEAALKCEGVGLALHLHKAECLFDPSGIVGVQCDARYFSIHEFSLADGTPGAMAWHGHGHGHAEIQWRDAAEIDVS